MAAPRTTYSLAVRSYETRPDGRVGSVSFLNWFQEAAFANSAALGFPAARYAEMGVTWVMRENDLQIVERPRYDETVHVTTWIADLQRVQSNRQYEARRDDGALLARCNTQWVMLDLRTQRPTRIPDVMTGVIAPAQDYVLTPIDWPTVEEGTAWVGERTVDYHEEDEMAHVNNAVYLKWIEENARRAARHHGQPPPTFHRHRLHYRLPAHRDDRLSLLSRFAPHGDGLAWQHEIRRGDDLLLRARSLSTCGTKEE